MGVLMGFRLFFCFVMVGGDAEDESGAGVV